MKEKLNLPVWNGAVDVSWHSADTTEFAIALPEQLAGLSLLVRNGNDFSGKIVKLGANIALNGDSLVNAWMPIGANYNSEGERKRTPFNGIFDGNGFEVSGIYIDKYESENHADYDQGLFGYVGPNGEVKNLGVSDSEIKVGVCAGGLVAHNEGVISNCYSSASITGISELGGLVGCNIDGGIISNCYSIGAVNGKSIKGGLVGISRSIVSNCYYNKETSGQNDPDKKESGEGKSTAEMQSREFADKLNSIAGLLAMNSWISSDGEYPVLSNQTFNPPNYFASGTGTEADPYIISTKEYLENFASLVNKGVHYSKRYIKMAANIELNNAPWTPIANFRGIFDGGGHAVCGLYINSTDDNQGMFGTMSGEIRNFGIADSNIKGCKYVGAIAAINEGSISSCFFTGTVTGKRFTGALIGLNKGTVSNCYCSCMGTENDDHCRFLGYNDIRGITRNCFYDSEISGVKCDMDADGKTTAEMQSRKFTDCLNYFAGLFSLNAWAYSEGKYPAQSDKLAKAIDIDCHFASGDGTEKNPYIVNTKEHLKNLATLVNGGAMFLDKYISLGANIALNDIAEWIPIGHCQDKFLCSQDYYGFRGIFDGCGYAISGVCVNSEGDNNGLFGVVNSKGEIKNLRVVASCIKGKHKVGGIVATNVGTISNCYFEGTVTGEQFVGGLAGDNDLRGIISNSHSAGSVTGTFSIGGFAGANAGIIKNCYSICAVKGEERVGGFTGQCHSGSISNCYYNKETSGQSDLDKGDCISTIEDMQSKDFADKLNFSAGLLSVKMWTCSEGEYPVLGDRIAEAINIDSYFASGTGTEENPYVISTKEHLENFALLVNMGVYFSEKFIKLSANIALSNTKEWIPIGKTGGFKGIFDGCGYVVSGVYINSENSNQGFFGILSDGEDVFSLGGAIKNLGIVDSHIKGKDRVGGLAGSNCGKINSCYFIGTVLGETGVGGLVGYNNYNGKINNCYSAGVVNGNEKAGGLVGEADNDNIDNCYYDKEVSGQSDEGKGEGETTAEMQSEKFADKLNFSAGFSSNNSWVYSKGKYPVLSDKTAEAISIGKYFTEQEGTAENPYIISTKEHLKNLSLLVNAGFDFNWKSIKITQDIALDGEEWIPIGIGSKPFYGSLDGDGHVISGIYINSENNNLGLFGEIGLWAEIKNLKVVDSYIKGNKYVGGLVGCNGGGTLKNCFFSGTVVGNSFVGLLAGFTFSDIIDCRCSGKVESQDKNYVSVGAGLGTLHNVVVENG